MGGAGEKRKVDLNHSLKIFACLLNSRLGELAGRIGVNRNRISDLFRLRSSWLRRRRAVLIVADALERTYGLPPDQAMDLVEGELGTRAVERLADRVRGGRYGWCSIPMCRRPRARADAARGSAPAFTDHPGRDGQAARDQSVPGLKTGAGDSAVPLAVGATFAGIPAGGRGPGRGRSVGLF